MIQPTPLELERWLDPTIRLAKQAGKAILRFYQHPHEVDIQIKADNSPVTQADLSAHAIIVEGLKALTPDIPILSEEAANVPYEQRRGWDCYWLVDPLDGTKEFIHSTDEFTVNIAMIVHGHSQLGVIYAPVVDLCYFAYHQHGAFKQENQQKPIPIHSRKKPSDHCVVAVSRRHSVEKAKRFLNHIPNAKTLAKGSSLKSCIIAEGIADLYPSFGPTSEWDMGAAQCIVEEAGGAMVECDLQPLRFNQKESLINPPLLVVGDATFDWSQYL